MKNAINHICESYYHRYSDSELHDLRKDMESEFDLVAKYSGRELLELLQNADDASADNVNIQLTDSYLSISNTGEPFTIENFKRLCEGSVSGKDNLYIGSKGIGFRSVWNWADEVSIESGKENVCISASFSKKKAERKLQELLHTQQIKKHIESQLQEFRNRKGVEPKYPVMKFPIYKEPAGHQLVTEIKIKIIDEDIRNKILEDIKCFDKYTLIFLPHIKRISFFINDMLINSFVKTGKDVISIKDKDDNIENFFFNSEEMEITEIVGPSKKLKMAVAIPEKGFIEKENLFCFFPIKNVKSPFKALLHATFCLTDNRNSLDDSKEDFKNNNRIIFEKLLDFYLKTVLARINDDRRLEFLCPDRFSSVSNYQFPGNIDGLNPMEFFFKCANKELFYSIQDKYLSISDSPILLKDCTKAIEQILENRLVKPILNESIYNYAKNLLELNDNLYFNYQEERIREILNKKAQNLTDDQRITIFKWWYDSGYTSLPKLLKDDKGNFIEDENIPCFLSSEGIKQIPDWAKSKISIINPKDEDLLLDYFSSEIKENKKTEDETPKRVLPRVLKKIITGFNIQEQSSRQAIISPVNNAIGDNYENAKEFVLWLWSIWKVNKFSETLKDISYNIPTRDKSVQSAKYSYIGKEYDNNLGELLFSCSKEYSAIDYLDFKTDNEENNPEEFLLFLGVMKLPQLCSKTFKYNLWSYQSDEQEIKQFTRNYVNILIEQYHPENDFNTSQDISAKLQTITNLESILKLSDITIFEWLFTCDSIKNTVISIKENENSYVTYIPYKCQSYYPYYPNTKTVFSSYLKYIFSNTKWISLGNSKYSPNELFLSDDSIFEEKFSIKTISDKDLKDKLECLNERLSTTISREDFKYFLKSLGMKTSILEFGSSAFYNILLKLPKFNEESFKTSRMIYRNIIDNYQDENQIYHAFYEPSSEKDEFFEKGKVLAKTKEGISKYESIKKVCFSSSAVYCLSEKLFIDVPTRSGKAADFKNIFNIEPPEESYNVEINNLLDVTDLNKKFKEDLSSYFPALMTFRKNDITEINKLNITLAKEVNVDGVIFTGDKYTLFKQTKNNWVIYVGNENNYQNVSKYKIANCLVQIFNVFYNYPAKEFLEKVETLFIYPPEYRSSFVENELGSRKELDETCKLIKDDSEEREKIISTICKEFEQRESSELIEQIKSISWFNTEDINTQKDIYHFLVSIKKDLHWLNQLLDYNISIASFYKWKLDCIWEESKNNILGLIYSNLIEKPIEEKKKFLSMKDLLKKNIYESITNCNFFEKPHKAFFDERLSDFYGNNCIDVSKKTESYSNFYETNFDYVKSKLLDDIDRFCNKQEYDSLLYFGDDESKSEINKIVTSILQELEKESKEEEEERNKEQSSFYQNIYNKIEDQSSILQNGVALSSGSNGSGLVTPKGQFKTQKQNKRQGNYAEYFVVLKLVNFLMPDVKDFLGEDYSVKWVSGAAKLITKFNSDPGGYDTSETKDNAGYDIEVISADKEKHLYIEVKSSSTNNCSFIMSANEKEKAVDLDDGITHKYRIVFVSNFNIKDPNCVPEIHYIDETVSDTTVFDAIPREYNIIYKKGEK